MNATSVIKLALTSTKELLNWYVSDLSDADLLVRPVPQANHIAWQLGHLVVGDIGLIKDEIPGANFPELPATWMAQHDKATAAQEPPKGFATKKEYLDLFNGTRDATIALVDKLKDADLDTPVKGKMAKFAPTWAALLLLCANHTTMHAAQFTVVRRKLGKPILF